MEELTRWYKTDHGKTKQNLRQHKVYKCRSQQIWRHLPSWTNLAFHFSPLPRQAKGLKLGLWPPKLKSLIECLPILNWDSKGLHPWCNGDSETNLLLPNSTSRADQGRLLSAGETRGKGWELISDGPRLITSQGTWQKSKTNLPWKKAHIP